MIFNPIKLSSEASVYKSYIGETGRRLADRFREHLRDAKKKTETNASKSVARHFNLQVSHDHRSFERNLSNYKQKPEKD